LNFPSVFMMRCLIALGGLVSVAASYEKISGYAPDSQVTDHNAVDLDQRDMEALLGQSPPDYSNAKAVYSQGGHSKSYAEFTLSSPLGTMIAKSTPISGTTASGIATTGKAYAAYAASATVIRVQYTTSDVQATYVGCQVGGIPTSLSPGQVTTFCFAPDNVLTFFPSGGVAFSVTPTSVVNKNGRTIQGFSTAAQSKMYTSCPGCPYFDYKMYYDYYGEFDYADKWVSAALDGTKFDLTNGDADFSVFNDASTRVEAAKKGSAYLNTWMYVIREFEDATDDCQSSCIGCNDDPVHAWDEGVAFYTGSLEGPNGAGSGKLLYALADKRCQNFKTCGTEGDAITGTSKVNYDLFDQFAVGQHELLTGQCSDVPAITRIVVAKMSVPLIQGTLRYAYKVDKLQGTEKEKAEGAVFAAAVLPRLHYCSAGAAATVYENMKLGATSTSFEAVKIAFEANYACMNITCMDVGGLVNPSTSGVYYAESSPCLDPGLANSSNNDLPVGATIGIIAAGILAVIFLVATFVLIQKEKAGTPIFKNIQTSEKRPNV